MGPLVSFHDSDKIRR
uniref:Uncharacterized protein n=1 Tax=Anopheles funestus TaxID=62324 RepID=A0A182S262_ANOFN